MERKNMKSYNQQNRKENIRRLEMKEWWYAYLEILSQLITQINILVDFKLFFILQQEGQHTVPSSGMYSQ
jgi:hypothetical protein